MKEEGSGEVMCIFKFSFSKAYDFRRPILTVGRFSALRAWPELYQIWGRT